MGRKLLDPVARLEVTFRVRMTADDHTLITKAAGIATDGDDKDGRGVTSAWARSILVESAKRKLAKAKVRS